MVAAHSRRYQRFLRQLKLARVEAGLTQVEAAKGLRQSQQFVSKSELGERRVDFVELENFARLYRKDLGFFSTATERDDPDA